jgi:hypothetical protein
MGGRDCSIMPIMCFSRKVVSHSHSAREMQDRSGGWWCVVGKKSSSEGARRAG